jgi:hypothetical protein
MRLDMLTTAGNVHEKPIRKVDTYLQNRRYIIRLLTMHTEIHVNNTDVSVRTELNKIWKSVGCGSTLGYARSPRGHVATTQWQSA